MVVDVNFRTLGEHTLLDDKVLSSIFLCCPSLLVFSFFFSNGLYPRILVTSLHDSRMGDLSSTSLMYKVRKALSHNHYGLWDTPHVGCVIGFKFLI
jgi:hypothetical protein